MENRAYAIATGAFVLLLAALLVASATWLGGTHTRGVPFDLVTEASVAGLSSGATIRLRGVEVGQVQSVGFDPSDQRRILVRALVDPHVRLPQGTHATISFLGLSGTAYVELDYPDTAAGVLQSSAAAPARIPMDTSGLAELTNAGSRLAATFTETLQRVNGVLTPETSRNISQFIEHANQAATGVTVLTHRLQPAARHLDQVIGNSDQLVQTVRATARDADSLIVTANSRGGAMDAVRDGALDTGQAARNLERALVDQTLPRVDILTERLTRTSDSLNQLLQQLHNEPQSLVFGPPPPVPGPGERGFRESKK